MLTIYDSNGNRRTDIEAGDSSTQVKEVQGDNVLTLSFTHYEYIALDVNDRVDFEGERYWLTERYTPKQKSGQEWVYDLKFYGIESLVRRFLVLETTDGIPEREDVLRLLEKIVRLENQDSPYWGGELKRLKGGRPYSYLYKFHFPKLRSSMVKICYDSDPINRHSCISPWQYNHVIQRS